MSRLCLFCGGDRDEPGHGARCDGRQGRVEATLLAAPYRAPFAAGRETSRAAGLSIEPTAESLCGQVLAEIRACGGLTCAELEERLQLRHQTASARVWDLHRRGHIRDAGLRRPTASGRRAVVWVAA